MIHFTKELDNLKGILADGFLFCYNNIDVMERIFSFSPDAHAAPGGMVCFCDLSIEDAYPQMKDVFGKYAVSVEKEWLISKGGRPVIYIDADSEEAQIIKRFVSPYFPTLKEDSLNHGYGEEYADSLDSWLKELTISNREMRRSFGIPNDVANLLDVGPFMQSSNNKDEKEWRVRSGKFFPNVHEYQHLFTRKEMIDDIKNAARLSDLRKHLYLKLDPDGCKGIYVPASRYKSAAEWISRTEFKNCNLFPMN